MGFGLGGGDTLNFGTGLNAVVATNGNLPGTVTSQGVYTVVGDTIYNADLSDYAAQDQAAGVTGRLIADAVEARGRTPVTTQGAGGDGRWASLTGGVVANSGDSDMAGYDGVIVSGSFGKDRGEGAGLFAGVSVSRVETDSGVDTDAIGIHGGMYGQWNGADYTLAAGLSYNDTERTQANNMVVGGLESASDSYLSLFIAPSLTWHGVLGGHDSLRLRYTGVWSDGHDFDFADGDLSVDSRFSHQVEARLAWTRALEQSTLRYGVDLGWQDDGVLDLVLAGNSLSGSTPGEDGYGRVFLGMDFANGGFEVGYDSNEELSATASYSWRF